MTTEIPIFWNVTPSTLVVTLFTSVSEDMLSKIQVLLETVYSTRSVQRGYKEDNLSKNSSVGREPPFTEDVSPKVEE
jgi:hypothetical protein